MNQSKVDDLDGFCYIIKEVKSASDYALNNSSYSFNAIGEFEMTTKEKVKREIDKLPDESLEKVYKYIHSLRTQPVRKKKIHTFNLKGQLDNVNIRERAYEY